MSLVKAFDPTESLIRRDTGIEDMPGMPEDIGSIFQQKGSCAASAGKDLCLKSTVRRQPWARWIDEPHKAFSLKFIFKHIRAGLNASRRADSIVKRWRVSATGTAAFLGGGSPRPSMDPLHSSVGEKRVNTVSGLAMHNRVQTPEFNSGMNFILDCEPFGDRST